MYNDINEYAKIYVDSFVNESQVNEGMVSVDDNYINTVQTLLKDLKTSNPKQYDISMKRVESKFGTQLPDAETWVATWRKNLGLDAAMPSRDDMIKQVGQKNVDDMTADNTPDIKITEVVVTNAIQADPHTVKVTYDTIWSDGSVNKDDTYTISNTENEFYKTKRWMHISNDVDAAIAMLFRSFALVSTYPIKFTFMNKKTHVKTDISKFTEIKNATKKSGASSVKSDPSSQFSSDLAAKMNRAYGSRNVKFSSIYDDEDIEETDDEKDSFNESAKFLSKFSNIF